jgi:signal transduction histidine kinase
MIKKLTQKTHKSLSLFLTIAVFSAIVLPAVLVGSFDVYQQYQKEVVTDPKNEAEALFSVLQKGLVSPLWTFTPENAEDLISGVALNPSVKAVIVIDSSGQHFAKYEQEGTNLSEQFIHLQADVVYETEHVGSVSLYYSNTNALKELQSSALQIFMIILIQLIVSISIILKILSNHVTHPLGELQDFAAKIAEQKFDALSPTVKHKEFAKLIDALDRMKNALQSSFLKLEDKVTARTKTLQTTNKELENALISIEQAQKTLVENEKLAALGSLVAGIAHELNTPIGNARLVTSSLKTDADNLKSKSDSNSLTKSEFERLTENIVDSSKLIERNISKAVTLIQNFKQVAVDRTSDRKREFNLNEFIREFESTVHHRTKNMPIEVFLDLDRDVEVYSYPGALSQVIDNFINNAIRHAFEDSALDKDNQGLITIATKVSDHHVALSVSDNGMGMSPDVQARIFEPFFTTKLGKGGSGLGMHIVHNLVNGPLCGKINISSNGENGSTFILSIPHRLEKELDDLTI